MAKVKSSKKKSKKMGRGRRLATGIDIGSYSVKIVTLAGDDSGQLAVRKVTVAQVDAGAGLGTPEELHNRRKSALKDALKHHGRLEGKVVLAIPRDVLMVRYLNLPSANPAELREMLFFDVERHVPFPVDELEVSYQVVEKLGDHETRIMMVCVPKKEIEPYMTLLEELDVEVHSIVPDVLGDCTAYSRTILPHETVAVVNFGRRSVNLSVMKNGELLFSRSLPASEEDMLKGFPRARGWKDLQGRITPNGVLNPREREHFTAWVEDLGLELLRSVSAFLCEAGEGHKIDRTILCGGAGFFPAGPPRGLALKLRSKVTIETALNGELPSSSKYQGTELSTSIGLAMWGLNSTPDNLNLLPEAFVQERIQQQKSSFRKNLATMLVLILFLVGGAGFVKWKETRDDYINVLAYYNQLKKETAQLDKMRKKTELIEDYIDSDNSCVNVVKSVLEILPPGTYLSNMTFTKRKSLEINGQMMKSDDCMKFIETLNTLKSPSGETYFVDMDMRPLNNVSLDLGTHSIQVVEFGVTCVLRWEDPLEKKKKAIVGVE